MAMVADRWAVVRKATVVGDRSRIFTIALGASWCLVVALPLLISGAIGRAGSGVPLLGVVVWIALLRAARWLSPAARADAQMRRGKYEPARALAEQELAISGENAWTGARRLVWLNRRTNALLGLGCADAALAASVEALDAYPDPETVANCAMALLRLNRYDEAAGAARLALSLTRERSLAGNAVLATVMLTRRMPAEAEALARAGLSDARALLPLVRAEPYALCLLALARAERAQGRKPAAERTVRELHQAGRRSSLVRAMALCEEVSGLVDTNEQREAGLALIADAARLAPGFVHWYLTQPDTCTLLRNEERFKGLRAAAYDQFAEFAAAAPPMEFVTIALASAQRDAHPRPAPQSSREALLMQVATLGGTCALLIWWTWRFLLAA